MTCTWACLLILNCTTQAKSTSEYNGVSLSKKSKKWLAYGHYNGKMLHLGAFENEKDAARCRDR